MDKQAIIDLLRIVYDAGYSSISYVAEANYREREVKAMYNLSKAFDTALELIDGFSENLENRDNQQGQIEVIDLKHFGKQTEEAKLFMLAVNIKKIQEHLNKPSETTKEFPELQPYEKKFLCTQDRITKRTGNISFTKGNTYIGYYCYGTNASNGSSAILSLKNNQGYTVVVKNVGFREMV